MQAAGKLHWATLMALTTLPALVIGAGLWMLGDAVPACSIEEHQRLTAPDNRFDLVTFSRTCGNTPPNAQSALLPVGDAIPEDAASFFSASGITAIDLRWADDGAIEIAVPEGATVFRQDENVAGVIVRYR